MKKILFFSVMALLPTLVFAQKARVFEHFNVNTAFLNKGVVPSMSYTQSLAFGKGFGIKAISGIRYSNFILNKSVLKSTSSSNEIGLIKNVTSSTFNIPIGVEIGNRLINVGVNADILGFTLGKQRDATYFETLNNSTTLSEPQLSVNRINFLPSGKGTLNSQIYVSVTPNPTLSLKVGMSYTQNTYNGTSLINAERKNWENFRKSDFAPFIGIQLNFEK